MKLFLYNQTRTRDLNMYQTLLNVSNNDLKDLDKPYKKLLLIGGGESINQPQFKKINTHITNVDFMPINTTRPNTIQLPCDFITTHFDKDSFDEIWALYSLPLYAKNQAAIQLFLAKSLLFAKVASKIRFFPLEFDNGKTLKTTDAEWDIYTSDCTTYTLNAISTFCTHGTKVEFQDHRPINPNRHEQNVIITLPHNPDNKNALNTNLYERINKIRRNCGNLNIEVFMSDNKRL